MHVYDSFQSFYEAEVEPRRRVNPDHRRLDGEPSGGNWDVVGRFRHQGRVWKVHTDTHYEPLALAYHSLTGSPPRDPFVLATTESGDRLDLAADLQQARGTPHRHLYAYSDD
ncbi:MAG TPA: hypothetical protein VFQ45_21845 [Longimicrobium sp.]|nr:hypothetical protein [Longimicrobium sp.]